MKTIDLHFESSNEAENTLLTMANVRVVIDYYWDSHGHYVDWSGPSGDTQDIVDAQSVEITEVTRTINMFGTDYDDEFLNLYIDGKKWPVTIDDYEYDEEDDILFISSVVGAG